MRLTSLIFAMAVNLMPALAAQAQDGPFSPVVRVNDSAITAYELEQRILFLQLLRFPGDIQAEAEKGLIEDRLRLATARQVGFKLTDEQIAAGMTEFASRANLDTEQFLAAIAQGGVEPETFRDFVEAGIAWRELVRGRFLPAVRVSEAEIDRARRPARCRDTVRIGAGHPDRVFPARLQARNDARVDPSRVHHHRDAQRLAVSHAPAVHDGLRHAQTLSLIHI